MKARRRVALWVVMVVVMLATVAGGVTPATAGPTRPARCRVVFEGRSMFMVCPCRGVTYRCEDWWGPIRKWRG